MRFRSFLFLPMDIHCSDNICWKGFACSLNCFCTCVKINWPYMCGSISGFSVLFHWPVCLSYSNTTLSYYYNCKISLTILGKEFFHFFQIVSAIPVPLSFCINFRRNLSMSKKKTKKLAGVLFGITLNL